MLLTPAEASERLRVPANTLKWWRTHGGGPDYVRLGGRIFYRPEALRVFIEANTVEAS
jgi:helix-turn-helix protein